MVNQVWGKHATVVTGSQDGSKQISKNEWNENLNRKGLLGFDSETIASASAITIPDNTSNDVSSFIKLSGVADVDTFVTTNTSEGDLLYIITTGSATLVNVTSPSSGEIRLLADDDKDLSTTIPTILMRIGSAWYEYGGEINTAHTVDAGDLTGTVLASGVVTTSITTVGTIGSGTWQGTAIADGYLGTGINATKLADGTVTSTELQYINTLSSNAQTQIDSKSATAGNASLVTVGTITSGTWNGTAIADAYLGTGINALKLADGTVTNTELQYINTLSSNAQTQIDSKSATAGNGSLVTVGALDSGSITSNFGTINNGSSTITTTGALGSGAITTSGTLTMGDNIITGIHSLDMDVDTIAYAATVDVDFDDNEVIILGDLTGNIAFTGSNYALGKGRTFHMESDGSVRTFTFPSGWVFYGTKPTETVASKKSILTLSCIGSAEADVRAVFVEEA